MKIKEKTKRSGIYLLPNLFTTASLFAAFYSIMASTKGLYEPAVIAIFIGMIADSLDGRIARLTNTQSEFGAQYDSLSDMVTFGVAPSLLLYNHALQQLGKIGWLICFIYTAAVALRLARFNTQVEVVDKRYFQGLPCPSAAAILSALTWLSWQQNWNSWSFHGLVACLTFGIAILMVSNVRYASFKELDFRGRVPFLHILGMVIIFAAIAVHPALVLFCGFFLYGLSGPFKTLIIRHKMRKQRRKLKIIK